MKGWIAIGNSAGRALRRGAVDVHARDVLYCAGGFGAGDEVYITFRGTDGGQYVVATGVTRCAEAELRNTLRSGDDVIIREQEIRLPW
jgi:hypothetical protein